MIKINKIKTLRRKDLMIMMKWERERESVIELCEMKTLTEEWNCAHLNRRIDVVKARNVLCSLVDMWCHNLNVISWKFVFFSWNVTFFVYSLLFDQFTRYLFFLNIFRKLIKFSSFFKIKFSVKKLLSSALKIPRPTN